LSVGAFGIAPAVLPQPCQKSNRDYWELKQNRNAARDKQNIQTLHRSGWKVLIIWECGIKIVGRLQRQLQRFLTDE